MKHGYSTYAVGKCRCQICLAAWVKYMRERRHAKKGIKPCSECGSVQHEREVLRLREALDAVTRRASSAELEENYWEHRALQAERKCTVSV